jgi:uncharacterized membrane protein HdeD (DUF308 family)
VLRRLGEFPEFPNAFYYPAVKLATLGYSEFFKSSKNQLIPRSEEEPMFTALPLSEKSGPSLKLLGILTIILGFMAIISPLLTGLSVVVLVGFLVLAGGVARLMWAFRAGSLGRGIFQLALGFLTLICGIVLVTDPLVGSGILTIMLTVYLVFDGVAEIMAALRAKPAPGWNWLLFGGIVSVLLGLMIWRQFPLSGGWAIGFLLGFKLLVVGSIMLGVGREVKSNS